MTDKEFLTPHDISRILDICYTKALEFIKFSGIKYSKIGRSYRVKRTTFERFISEHNNINTRYK